MGIFASEPIQKNQFIVEYRGNNIEKEHIESVERKYDQGNYGSYMYYFNHNNKVCW